MELRCPSCGLPFKADDVDFGARAARCRACDRAFALDALVEAKDEAPAYVEALQKGMDPPKPSKVHETVGYEGLTLSYRWFQAGGLGLLFFALFWDGFLVVWYTIAFTTHAPLIMFIFPILHVLVGVLIGYAAFTSLLNKTTIQVSGDRVKVHTGPIPVGGNKELFASEIKQLYVFNKSNKRSDTNKGVSIGAYDLQVLKSDGTTASFVKSIPDFPTAAYIERKIESYLGIKDEPVKGERLGA